MQISRYVFSHQVEREWWGLYTPFEHGVCFIPEAIWQKLTNTDFGSVDRAVLEELINRKMVVEDGFDATSLDRYRRRAMTRINAMYLVVVQQCNLACRYCVVENNVTDPRRMKDRMSVATALASLGFFTRLLQGRQPSEARVTYYGGEPLLNPKVIKETLPRIRNISTPGLQRPVEAVMITNGTIFNEETARLFKKYESPICVSIDGLAEHQDAARVTHKNRGTHNKVVETIKRYQDMDIRLGLSCTIGRHNVEALPDVARYFVEEIGVREIEFQMPYQVPDEGNAFYVPMSETAELMLRAASVMIDELGVNEFTTLRRLESFINGHWRHRDCGAAGGQVVISPAGKVGPCHSLVGSGTCFQGDIHDPDYDFFNDPVFDEWSSRIPVTMPQCEGCSGSVPNLLFKL